MATSGTTNFNPGLGDLVLDALGRIQVRGPQITVDHLMQARREANLLNVEWMNRGPNLWLIEAVTLTLQPGVATYALDHSTIALFEVVIEQTANSGNQRMLAPLSRTEYAQLPDKVTQGQPNQYWFNRQSTPQLVFWQPPDASYVVTYYRMRQAQDAALGSGATLDIPYRWIDAFVCGLALRLARHFKPELVQQLKADYVEAYGYAQDEDTEGANLYFVPGMSGYYR